MQIRMLALAAVSTALLTTACGGSGAHPATSAAAPTASVSEVESSAPAPAASGVASSACKPPKKLKTAKLSREGDSLTITWTLADVPSSFDTLLLSATAASSDGQQVLQFGAKYVNGAPSEAFVYDFVSAQQTNLDPPPALGPTVEVSYPLAGTVFADGEFRWYAVLSVDGDDVAGCPSTDPEQKVAFPGE